MKVIKAMKKLKFWSKKKKKKKNHFLEQPPPSCHCHHHYYPVQPSAPPLPSWMDYEQPRETVIAPEVNAVSGLASSSQSSFAAQDSAAEISISCPAVSASTSYQQYMVPNPVYGVPVVPEVRRERAGGAFGCVISIGVHLIRCFFPCFHIREVKKNSR